MYIILLKRQIIPVKGTLEWYDVLLKRNLKVSDILTFALLLNILLKGKINVSNGSHNNSAFIEKINKQKETTETELSSFAVCCALLQICPTPFTSNRGFSSSCDLSVSVSCSLSVSCNLSVSCSSRSCSIDNFRYQ